MKKIFLKLFMSISLAFFAICMVGDPETSCEFLINFWRTMPEDERKNMKMLFKAIEMEADL